MKVLWQPYDKLLVAVSGGIDSVVLLHWLISQSHSYQKLSVVHVDHGLRVESQQDYQFVEQLVQTYQIDFYGYHCDVKTYKQQHHLGTQQAAREVRYDCFDQAMLASESTVLLTAHHSDDQAETIMYRLLTGRFYQQSLGISSISMRQSYYIIRPLLQWSRQEIQQYYEQQHLNHVEDASNAQLTYHRNQIRHLLMPVCQKIVPNARQQLQQFERQYQMQQQFIIQYSQKVLSQLLESVNQNEIVINRLLWQQQDEIIQQTMLYQLCQQYAEIIDLKHGTVLKACNIINTAQGEKQYYLKRHCLLRVSYDRMTLLVNDIKNISNNEPIILQQQNLNQCLYFGQYQCLLSTNKIDKTSIAIQDTDLPICIRSYRQGDRIPLNKGNKKVQRLFIDKKLPQHLRQGYPIVENNKGEIIAVGCLYRQQKSSCQYYLTINVSS